MAKIECSWRVALISLVGAATSCQHAPAGSRPSTTSIAMPVVSAPPAVITSSAVVPPEPVQPNPIQSQADCPKDMVFVPEGDLSYTAAVPGKKDKTARAQHFHVRAFCIDRVEPQNRDWKQVLQVCGKRESNCNNSSYLSQPLDCVTHEQARCFCEHSPSGVKKRLPTDSEWLHAALGNDGRKFPWGNDVVPPQADERNFCVPRDNVDVTEWLCNPAHNTMDRSPFGVLGMASNGWELNGTCTFNEDKPGEACMGRHADGVRNPYLSSQAVDGLAQSFWLSLMSERPVNRANPSVSFRCATSKSRS